MKNKLISVIIITYKEFDFLKEAIDSVLIQDYSNIELIISDDASPNFDKKHIKNMLNNKGDIISNFVVTTKERNGGITSNVNHALKHVSGEFIFLLDGDDIFYNSQVLSNIMNDFIKYDSKIMLGFRHNYTHDMKNFVMQWPEKKTVDFFKNSDCIQSFKRLACYGNGIIHGSGIAFQKKLLSENVFFDETYKMVEDWSFFLKLLRKNNKIHFVDIVTIKYRLGGISNGEVTNLDFLSDGPNIILKEIMPYFEKFSFNRTEKYFVKYNLFRRLKKKYKVQKKYLLYFSLGIIYLDVIIEKICRQIIRKLGFSKKIEIC